MNLAAHSAFDSLAPAVLNAIPHPVVVIGVGRRVTAGQRHRFVARHAEALDLDRALGGELQTGLANRRRELQV